LSSRQPFISTHGPSKQRKNRAEYIARHSSPTRPLGAPTYMYAFTTMSTRLLPSPPPTPLPPHTLSCPAFPQLSILRNPWLVDYTLSVPHTLLPVALCPHGVKLRYSPSKIKTAFILMQTPPLYEQEGNLVSTASAYAHTHTTCSQPTAPNARTL
jgi:hypothetical protein